MAKYYTVQDLLSSHKELRKIVSDISKQTETVRREAAAISQEAEKLYATSGLGRQELKNAIKSHVKAHIDTVAKPIRDAFAPKLKAMEGIRLELEAARDNLMNPVRRINAVTVMDKNLAAERRAATELLQFAGPVELQVIADAAQATGDIATLAAVISRNNQLSPDNRPFSNAEVVAGAPLPDQDAINAVYQELNALPQYAIACSRAFQNLGNITGTDRIQLGLAERKVEVHEDGTLKDLDTAEVHHIPDSRAPETSYESPFKPEDPNLSPADFNSMADYTKAGGDLGKPSAEDWTRWGMGVDSDADAGDDA